MTKSFAKIANLQLEERRRLNAKNKMDKICYWLLLVMLLVYGTKLGNFIDLSKCIMPVLYAIAHR